MARSARAPALLTLLLAGACAAPPPDRAEPDGAAGAETAADAFRPHAEAGPSTDATHDAAGDATLGLLVSLEAPFAGDIVGGSVPVRAVVQSPQPLRGVEFSAGGQRFDTDLLAPYEAILDSTRLPDGPITLAAMAVAFDDTAVTAEVQVVVDNTPPAITLVAPAPEAPLFHGAEGLDVIFDVTDTSPVTAFSAAVNGVPLVVAGGPPRYTAHLDYAALGDLALPRPLTITATATDARGVEGRFALETTLRSRLAFAFQTFGAIWSSPAVATDGTVYIGSHDTNLYAVRPDGTEAWHFGAEAEIPTRPVVAADGAVIFAAGDRLFALGPDGTRRWAWRADGALASSPALSPDGQTVYVGSYSDSLYALRVSDGGLVWGLPTEGDVLSSPAVAADGTVVFGSHDHFLRGVTPGGSELWRFQTGGEIWGRPLVAREALVVFGSNDGYAYGVGLLDGVRRWERELRGEIWGGAAEGPDGTLYLGSTFRRLVALDPAGGERWQVETGGLAQSTPVVDAAGTIYIGSTDHMLYAIGADGVVRWRWPTEGEIIGSPALSRDESLVYVGSSDRRLYALHTGATAPADCAAPEMVAVGDFEIMRYEASRPDATAEDAGQDGGRVCSRAGVLPASDVDFVQARDACAAAGLALCTAEQWARACQGPIGTDYPYGAAYDGGACNGADHPATGCLGGACAAAACGASPACGGSEGVLDLSGNLREWTATESPVNGAGFRLVRGGSFRSGAEALRCAHDAPAETHLAEGARADDLGFRCCRGR